MKEDIFKKRRLIDAEKDCIKEQVVANIQRNESVAFDIHAGYYKTDNTLKQANNDCVKTSATKNEYNKFENSQLQTENSDYTESKIEINKMRQNIIRELAKVTNNDMKDRAP